MSQFNLDSIRQIQLPYNVILATTSLFAGTLISNSASAAINCNNRPSCSDLGYKTSVASSCPQDGIVYCPYDLNYKKCIIAEGEIDCSAYTLTACPATANCSMCGIGTKISYKIDSCKAGNTLENNTCRKLKTTCEDYGYFTDNPSSSPCTECPSLSITTETGAQIDCYSNNCYSIDTGACGSGNTGGNGTVTEVLTEAQCREKYAIDLCRTSGNECYCSCVEPKNMAEEECYQYDIQQCTCTSFVN